MDHRVGRSPRSRGKWRRLKRGLSIIPGRNRAAATVSQSVGDAILEKKKNWYRGSAFPERARAAAAPQRPPDRPQRRASARASARSHACAPGEGGRGGERGAHAWCGTRTYPAARAVRGKGERARARACGSRPACVVAACGTRPSPAGQRGGQIRMNAAGVRGGGCAPGNASHQGACATRGRGGA